MKLRSLFWGVAGVVLAFAAASTASADTINFWQFGPNYSVTPNVVTGVTTGGVSFTITGPGYGFDVLQQGVSWGGDFPTNEAILDDIYTPGAVTIAFATPITSLTGLTLEPVDSGTFTATASFYDGSTLVGTSSFSNPGAGIPHSLPSFDISGSAITSIVLSSTLDADGFAFGPSAVPEPATWAMLIVGVAMIGFAARRRNASVALAA